METGLPHYLIVSALLFSLGLLGVIARRSLLVMYMSLELMLNAANLALVAFSRFNQNLNGQVMVFFIITVAAAEVASPVPDVPRPPKRKEAADAPKAPKPPKSAGGPELDLFA